MTPLDLAHAEMEADPSDTAARMRFYARLADAELSLVLSDAAGDKVRPQIFPVEGIDFALLFDTDLRMVEFCGDGVEYLQASGRQIAQMLRDKPVGIALNPGFPSAILLPPDAVGWLADMLDEVPKPEQARPTAVHSPGDVPDLVIRSLDAKLAGLAGLAVAAYLVRLDYDGRAAGHAVIFEAAISEAEPAIAAAVAEALRFSGLEAGTLDVLFLPSDHPLFPTIRRHALRFDLPEPQMPGRKPDAPPKLR